MIGDVHATAAPGFVPKTVTACPLVPLKHEQLVAAFSQPILHGWSNSNLLKLKMFLTEAYKQTSKRVF